MNILNCLINIFRKDKLVKGDSIINQIKNFKESQITLTDDNVYTLNDLEDVIMQLRKSKKLQSYPLILDKKWVIEIELKFMEKLGYTKRQILKAEKRMNKTLKNCLYKSDGFGFLECI